MAQKSFETKQYTIGIAAPAATVWATMLDDVTYREWTGAFHEGSRYEGSWDLGSDIKFTGPDGGGLVAKVVANRPNEFVSLEYVGFLDDGELDTSSELSREFAGAHEDYSFAPTDSGTTLTVDLEISAEMLAEMDEMWPAALLKLKEIAERQ